MIWNMGPEYVGKQFHKEFRRGDSDVAFTTFRDRLWHAFLGYRNVEHEQILGFGTALFEKDA